MVEGLLLEILKLISIPSFCYICYLGLKLFTLNMICKHPELSDNKVKYITNMVTKNKHKINHF